MKPSEILTKAAEKLSTPGVWCQHELAIDAEGNGLDDPLHAGAVCWCMGGAMVVVGGGAGVGPEDRYLDRALAVEDYVKWNDQDGRTQEECVVALLRAAALARSEGN